MKITIYKRIGIMVMMCSMVSLYGAEQSQLADEQSISDARLAEESCYALLEQLGVVREGCTIEDASFADLLRARTQHADLIKEETTKLDKAQNFIQNGIRQSDISLQNAVYIDYCLGILFAASRTLTLTNSDIASQALPEPTIRPVEILSMVVDHMVYLMKELRSSLAQRGINMLEENLTGQLLGLLYPLYIRTVTTNICMCWFSFNLSAQQLSELLQRQARLSIQTFPPVIEVVDGIIQHGQS